MRQQHGHHPTHKRSNTWSQAGGKFVTTRGKARQKSKDAHDREQPADNQSNAVRDGQGATGKLSSGLGNAAGGAASGAAGKVTAGARKLVGKIGSGIKGGFNQVRGK